VTLQDLMFNLDLPEDMTLADMTAAVSMELPNSSTSRFNLYHNGQLLEDQTKTLKEYNIQANDLIAVHTPAPPVPPRQPAQQQRPQQQPQQGQYDSEMIRLQAIGNPQLRDQLRNSNPELADALNDPDRFRTLLAQMEQQRREAEHQKQREIVR
jgi:DNA damage-inducible protein 1